MRDAMRVFGINMAPQNRRRFLVGAVYALLFAVWAFVVADPNRNGIVLLLMATIINAAILGGYGRRGLVKPFISHPLVCPGDNDERDRARRDRMHFLVYRFVIVLFILGYVLGVKPFHQGGVGRALMLLGMFLAPTLPQALLLWSEPDLVIEEVA
jgi:hypothetical protein